MTDLVPAVGGYDRRIGSLLSYRRLEDTVTLTTLTAASLVADAKTRIENLSPAEVEFELASGDALLIDIREADERAASGTIAGAIHAPRGMLEFYADPTGPYYRPGFDPDRRLSCIAPAAGVPLWRRLACKRWAIATWRTSMAASSSGKSRVCRSSRGD